MLVISAGCQSLISLVRADSNLHTWCVSLSVTLICFKPFHSDTIIWSSFTVKKSSICGRKQPRVCVQLKPAARSKLDVQSSEIVWKWNTAVWCLLSFWKISEGQEVESPNIFYLLPLRRFYIQQRTWKDRVPYRICNKRNNCTLNLTFCIFFPPVMYSGWSWWVCLSVRMFTLDSPHLMVFRLKMCSR